MNCRLETIQENNEDAWIISISCLAVAELIIQLVALEAHKISKIKLQDVNNHLFLIIACDMDKKEQKAKYTLKLVDHTILITKAWIEVILSMLLDIILLGWSDSAHIDYEFVTNSGIITVCLVVDPPCIN